MRHKHFCHFGSSRMFGEPSGQGRGVGRKAVMIDRPFQHLQNREDKGKNHKRQQRCHQKESAPFGFALRPRQRRFKRAAVGGAQHLGGRGQISHRSSLRQTWARQQAAPRDLISSR